MKCPCCGGTVPSIDIMFLLEVDVTPIQEEILKTFIDVYPRGLTMNELIERVYLHRDEPNEAKRSMMVSIKRLNDALTKHRWVVDKTRYVHGGRYKLAPLPQVEPS